MMICSESNPQNVEKTAVRNLMRKHWILTVAVLLCCAPMAFGDQITMTLQPMPSGQPSLGGVYTGAYPFSINGSTSITTAVSGDFNNEIYAGKSWHSNVYSFSTLNANAPIVLLGQNASASQLQDNDGAARLVKQMYMPADAATAGRGRHLGIFMRQIPGWRYEGDDPPVVAAPESPSPVLLGEGLFGLATLIFLFRRRTLRTQS